MREPVVFGMQGRDEVLALTPGDAASAPCTAELRSGQQQELIYGAVPGYPRS